MEEKVIVVYTNIKVALESGEYKEIEFPAVKQAITDGFSVKEIKVDLAGADNIASIHTFTLQKKSTRR